MADENPTAGGEPPPADHPHHAWNVEEEPPGPGLPGYFAGYAVVFLLVIGFALILVAIMKALR